MPAKPRTVKSPWLSAKTREGEREEKRLAILHTAAHLFSSKGYYRTSLDDIALELGITKPTLYYYARNKDDLIAQVASIASEEILRGREGDENASGLEQLRYFLRRYAGVTATETGRCLVLLADFDVGDEAADRVRTGKRQIDQHIRDLLALGVQDGSIGPCDIKLTTFMLAGSVNGIGRWFHEDRGLSAERVAEVFVNQMTSGLAPRP
ncbi:TetR/AcrR family transcriptional regulator [soil metagenome]